MQRQDKKSCESGAKRRRERAETKLDSRKDSSPIIQGLERRATDVAKHAHCKRYDCANTTSIPPSNYSRNSFFAINSKSHHLHSYASHDHALLSTLQNSHVILNYITTIDNRIVYICEYIAIRVYH